MLKKDWSVIEVSQEMYFFEVLNMLFNDNNVGIRNNRDLIERMEPGTLTFRNLQRYRKGVSVPRFETALKMFACFGATIENDKLEKCIKAGREYAKSINNRNNISSIGNTEAKSSLGITVNNAQISCVVSPELMNLLKERIECLYGDSSNVRLYLADLVEKDLLLFMKKKEKDQKKKPSSSKE